MYLTLMEQRQRLDVFRENLAEIKRWNWRAALVESSGRAVDAARFAVNQFADMSREELVKVTLLIFQKITYINFIYVYIIF